MYICRTQAHYIYNADLQDLVFPYVSCILAGHSVVMGTGFLVIVFYVHFTHLQDMVNAPCGVHTCRA